MILAMSVAVTHNKKVNSDLNTDQGEGFKHKLKVATKQLSKHVCTL